MSMFPGAHPNYDPYSYKPSHKNTIPFFAGYPLYYHGDDGQTLTQTKLGDQSITLSGNLIHGRHEFSITYDNECQTIGAPIIFECNSPPVVNPATLTYNLYVGQELDVIFSQYFTEPIDLDPEDLLYTIDTVLPDWPSWLAFYPNYGWYVGIANQTGSTTHVIRGTDEFGLFAELTIIINVIPEFPITYNGQDSIWLWSNQTFTYKLNEWIFDDPDI